MNEIIIKMLDNIVIIDDEANNSFDLHKFLEANERYKIRVIKAIKGITYESITIKDIQTLDSDLYEQLMEAYRSSNNCFNWVNNIPHDNLIIIKSLEDFNNKKNEIKQIKGKTLWCIDLDLCNNNYNHIVYTLSNFQNKIERKTNDIDVYLIYSNTAKKYDTYDKVITFLNIIDTGSLIDKKKDIALSINFIEKSYEGITSEALNLMIIKSSKINYLLNCEEVYLKSFEKIKKEIYDISKNKRLFHYDCLAEGSSIDVNTYNILQNEIESNYFKSLENNTEMISHINEYVTKYYENCDLDKLNFEKICGRIQKNLALFSSPYNVRMNYINPIKLELSFGDIIQIDKYYYFIANQLCNMTLRENGKRIDKNALLIPLILDEINNETILSKKKEIISSILKSEKIKNIEEILKEVNFITQGNFKVDDFNDKAQSEVLQKKYICMGNSTYSVSILRKKMPLVLPFSLLDFISFNANGEVNFSADLISSNFSLRKRSALLLNEKNEMEAIAQKHGLKFSQYLNIKYDIKFSDSINSLVAKIKRCGRLEYAMAEDMYKSYQDYQTRKPSREKIFLK